MVPVSTYGASKLAGEALLASYAAMFGLTARAFRFGNVVGPQPDPRRRLRLRAPAARRPDPSCGSSATAGRASPTSTSRTSSTPCCSPARRRDTPFDVFNVATGDYITVTEIAELAMEVLGLEPGSDALRLHRRRPRLEGRRAGRADRHRPDPLARAGRNRAHRAGGAARLDGVDGRRRPRRAASARDPAAGRLPRPRRGAQRGLRRGRGARCRRARRTTSGCCRGGRGLRGVRRGAASRWSWSPTSPTSARGTLDPADARRHARRLREALPLDDIVVCPHDDAGRLPRAASRARG